MTTHVWIGDVRTMDGASAEALAWRGDRLIAVGARDDVLREAGDATIEDLGGATVLPGFIDAHHHASIAVMWGGTVRLSPPAVTDIASLQRLLREAARDVGQDDWVVVSDWDELNLAERRPPTRAELDDAVPDHPLLAMHYSCHRALANSRALELAGIDRNTPEPSGGQIVRGKGGIPTGLLVERGMSRVESLARQRLTKRDPADFFARLTSHHRALAAVGITRLVDTAVPTDLETLYREAQRIDALIVPTVMMRVSTTGYLEPPWDVIERGPDAAIDGMLSVGPLKLVLDGAPGCSMCLSWWQAAGGFLGACAMTVKQRSLDSLRSFASLEPRIGPRIRTGIRIHSPADAVKLVGAAASNGITVGVHAVGNDAIAIAIDALERAGNAVHRGGTPRIEHATFLDRAAIARIASLGVAIVTQPHFLSIPTFGAAPTIPGLRNTALRWLLDARVPVAGSSDYPVAGFDPLDAIRSAVTRRTARGGRYEPDQAIELDEALDIYTRQAAKIIGAEDCGTLAPGKRADLIALDRKLDDASLAQARVRTTVIGGAIVA